VLFRNVLKREGVWNARGLDHIPYVSLDSPAPLFFTPLQEIYEIKRRKLRVLDGGGQIGQVQAQTFTCQSLVLAKRRL